MGAALVSQRQERGMQRFLAHSKLALEDKGRCRTHINLVPMWDEVQAKTQTPIAHKYRIMTGASPQRFIVPRGLLTSALADLESEQIFHTSAWLINKPLNVGSTSVAALHPAIVHGIAPDLEIQNVENLLELLKCVSSYTMAPMCDACSGNVSILKQLGFVWDMLILGRTVGRILFMPDLSFNHAHHRSKNAVKGLRPHLMKHFLIVAVNRQPTNLQHVIHNIEKSLVLEPFTRVFSPLPEDALTLRDVADILFNLDGTFHESDSGKSQRAQDVENKNINDTDNTNRAMEHTLI